MSRFWLGGFRQGRQGGNAGGGAGDIPYLDLYAPARERPMARFYRSMLSRRRPVAAHGSEKLHPAMGHRRCAEPFPVVGRHCPAALVAADGPQPFPLAMLAGVLALSAAFQVAVFGVVVWTARYRSRVGARHLLWRRSSDWRPIVRWPDISSPEHLPSCRILIAGIMVVLGR